MNDEKSNGFWAEGPERLRDALRERRPLLERLRMRFLKADSAAERHEIEAEVRQVVEEYQPTQEEMDHCLHLLL